MTAKQIRALVNSFDWESWQEDLEPGLLQAYGDLVTQQGQEVAKANGVTFDVDDPMVSEHMTAYVGDRVKQLTRTTKKDVTNALRSALAGQQDLSTDELRNVVLDTVRQKYDGYESWRALRIARTESAIAYNSGGVLGGLQAGFERYDVTDGTSDEECAAANGAIWTADQCLENPLGHPNCSRVFSAHPEDDDEG